MNRRGRKTDAITWYSSPNEKTPSAYPHSRHRLRHVLRRAEAAESNHRAAGSAVAGEANGGRENGSAERQSEDRRSDPGAAQVQRRAAGESRSDGRAREQHAGLDRADELPARQTGAAAHAGAAEHHRFAGSGRAAIGAATRPRNDDDDRG